MNQVSDDNGTLTESAVQKRAILEMFLPLCPFVRIDATRRDVVVPSDLVKQNLTIRVGRTVGVMEMPDLVIDSKGFRATISIRGILHHIDIPWHAVEVFTFDHPFRGPVVGWRQEPVPQVVKQEPKKVATLRVVK